MRGSLFNAGPFSRAREKLFADIHFKPADKILFVGVGTGADIERLPYEKSLPYEKLEVTAIDYLEDMLEKAQVEFEGSKIGFFMMDAQQLDFPSESFDYVIGSLILSVVPDSEKALGEMTRVCRQDGMVLISDKFG